MMTKPTKAYKMGVLACQENESVYSNPFLKGIKEWTAWKKGFIDRYNQEIELKKKKKV